VAELLDPETGWRNYNLINALFSPTEVAKVCSVVPSPMSKEDKLVWPGSKNGCFTVRSAYHLEMDRRVQDTGEASNVGDIQHFLEGHEEVEVFANVEKFLMETGQQYSCYKGELIPERYSSRSFLSILPYRGRISFSCIMELPCFCSSLARKWTQAAEDGPC
jgi:hypothetical protein